MSTTTGPVRSTNSPWGRNVRMPQVQPLARDVKTEVCIVGAGIAGLSVGYHLAKAGKRVVIVSDGRIGGGQTQLTTAHISNAIDRRYADLERIHGAERARLAAASHTSAIAAIEQTVRDEGIDCEFRRLNGYLFQPPGESGHQLEEELDAARRAGVPDVELIGRSALRDFETGPCLRFGGQGEFHPLKYLAGLSRAIIRLGGTIYSPTRAEQIDGGSPARIDTPAGAITADVVVVATNSPINNLVTMHTKQVPFMTYAIAARVPPGTVEAALYWDTADPYHYVRLRPLRRQGGHEAADLMIIGGEDHKSGRADNGAQRFASLESWARERFHALGEIEYRWAGQVMETIDGLAYIGANPGDDENVFIVTGGCGQGMTHGTIAGMLISDLIFGRENPWAAVYNPARMRAASLGEYVKESASMAAQYAAWATSGEVNDPEEVKAGSGAILRRGLKKIAVYRNQDGQLIERSAVCTHLNCIVAWNSVEQTWDCPCHGSRFTPEGEVISGPAVAPLAELTD